MPPQDAAPPRSATWLAVLRIAVGVWFLKSLFTKVVWQPFPTVSERWQGFLPERLAEYAAGNPLGWYASFLTDFAIPKAELFAALTAYGESAIGLALTFGLLTTAAAAGGAFMMANYFLASFWMGPGEQGFHLLLLVCMVVFAGGHAGRTLGMDGIRLRRNRSRSARVRARAAKRPLSEPA